MSRSLEQWIEHIQFIHARTIDLGLDRVASVWKRFKPEHLPPVIAVAGTNGKGSSVSMLESIYRHAGYSTGAFTSPHLVHFNERICLNNVPVSNEKLLQSFEKIESIRADTTLTFFEFNTLLALDVFSQSDLDIILLEVGLGGRLDAVNIIDNDLALITAIGIDHTAWLGHDKETIGAEKAGIIKCNSAAVIADTNAPASIERIAQEQTDNYVMAGREFYVEQKDHDERYFKSTHPKLLEFDHYKINALLQHEINNTAGVIASVGMLAHKLPVSYQQLSTGIENQSLTGRLQLIQSAPMVLLDVSHNEDSVRAMIAYLKTLNIKGAIHAVFGALADKNYTGAVARLGEIVDAWYLTSLEGDRGQTAVSLKNKLTQDSHINAQNIAIFESPSQAFDQVKLVAHKNDLIVIFGSFHVVGAIIARLDL